MKISASPAKDLFAQAREKFSIIDVWHLLGLEGTPKASCKSPFREDRHPSFSIHTDGSAWTDHATGQGGDVVEFIRHGIKGEHRDVREWLKAHLGSTPPPPRPVKASQPTKAISWPGELVEGTAETWKAFTRHRGLHFPAVHAMVQAGFLRFIEIDGAKCYVITDGTRRAAEIRRMDGKLFGGSKTYPLRGVDKGWLPGIDLLRDSPKSTAVLITEGATDLLSACDLYSRYRRNHGGTESWQPAALLGASCKNLHTEAVSLLRGRRVRLVPDGDEAGDGMAEHWTGLLRRIGCVVDVVNLPHDTDLTDHVSTLSPTDLFTL